MHIPHITFHVCCPEISTQIVDVWYAKKQALSAADQYQTELICNYNHAVNGYPEKDVLNIGLGYVFDPKSIEVYDRYDLFFFGNGGEALETSGPLQKTILEEPNVYLVSNSLLAASHAMAHKNIWFPDAVMTCCNYWTRHFYPQYFENQNFAQHRRKPTMAYVGGHGRAHRRYFIDLLLSALPNITVVGKYDQGICVLNDCQWETDEDKKFREWVNDFYGPQMTATTESSYYDDTVKIGIDNKFGDIPPGFFLLPCYYENSCVIFPETSWINNELCLTEKALKCFYSGSLPFPVGGANLNQLYNSIGFCTAWNLLPDQLRKFDAESDHKIRFDGSVEALKWLSCNYDIFESCEFAAMTQQNKLHLLQNINGIHYLDKFDRIVQTAISAFQGRPKKK